MPVCDKSAECDSGTLRKTIRNGVLAILGTLLVQIVAAVFWAGSMSARMTYVEKTVDRCEARIRSLELCASRVFDVQRDVQQKQDH